MTPSQERVVERLREKNCAPHKEGEGWTAHCPLHDNAVPSLRVRDSHDGKAVIWCENGCGAADVADSIGADLEDVSPSVANPSTDKTPGNAGNQEVLSVSAKSRQPQGVLRRQPFPTELLPDSLRTFVEAVSRAMGCPPEYVALPLLSAGAGAIGNSRVLQLKQGWEVVSVIWTAVIGESGTKKSPPFQVAIEPLQKADERASQEYDTQWAEYTKAKLKHDKELLAWKRNKKNDEDPPLEPTPPPRLRHVTDDVTIEALAELLRDNPRGLVVGCEELSGWFGRFNAYKSGNSDEAHWLKMFGARWLMVDRKTSAHPSIRIPRASVSVTGTIQPKVLDRTLGLEHRESGMFPRFLVAWPPRRAARWTDGSISPQLKAELEELFTGLLALTPRMDDNGQPAPRTLALTPDAKDLWVTWYDRHNAEQVEQSGECASAFSKLEEYPARIALVFHCVRVAAGDPSVDAELVDKDSLSRGIGLAEWFKHEHLRVLAMQRESGEQQAERRLIEWVEQEGGSATPRELTRAKTQEFPSSDKAEEALEGLRRRGHGVWVTSPSSSKGGRPKREFNLHHQSPLTKPPNHRESGGYVSPTAQHTAASGDDWGVI